MLGFRLGNKAIASIWLDLMSVQIAHELSGETTQVLCAVQYCAIAKRLNILGTYC